MTEFVKYTVNWLVTDNMWIVFLVSMWAVFMLTYITVDVSIRRENDELSKENAKLRARNRKLEQFAEIAKEEEDKRYVRGYYDSLGAYTHEID